MDESVDRESNAHSDRWHRLCCLRRWCSPGRQAHRTLGPFGGVFFANGEKKPSFRSFKNFAAR